MINCCRSEIWESCYSFPGYDVSSCGRFWSIKRGRLLKTHKLISNCRNAKDRLGISLRKNNKSIHKYTTPLIAYSFFGLPKKGYEINHKDGEPQNNHILNLEYVTHSENFKHAYRTGLMRSRKGEGHWRNKLDNLDIKRIRSMHRNGHKQSFIGRLFKVHQSSISYIVNNKSWAHLKEV